MAYEAKPNTGSLWSENNCKVVRKGKIKFGNDEKYCSIIKYEDKEGNEKYELAISVGLLHYNAPEDKYKPTSPDIGGKITVDSKVYKFGGYVNTTNAGDEYTGVSLIPENEDQDKPKF